MGPFPISFHPSLFHVRVWLTLFLRATDGTSCTPSKGKSESGKHRRQQRVKAADGAAAAGLSSDHIASGGSLSGAKSETPLSLPFEQRASCYKCLSRKIMRLEKKPPCLFDYEGIDSRRNTRPESVMMPHPHPCFRRRSGRRLALKMPPGFVMHFTPVNF